MLAGFQSAGSAPTEGPLTERADGAVTLVGEGVAAQEPNVSPQMATGRVARSVSVPLDVALAEKVRAIRGRNTEATQW